MGNWFYLGSQPMLITCVGGGNHGQILVPVEELLVRRVPECEKHRIESHKFYLATAVAPSSTATFRGNPFPTDRQFQLLIVEWKFLFQLRRELEQVAAVLLHEIGHTLNPPPAPNITEAEHHADDYARHCRFGPPLRHNLMKCLQANMEGFDQTSTQERIRRIEANDQLKLNLIAPR